MAIPTYPTIQIYDIDTGKLVLETDKIEAGIWEMRYSPDGKLLAAALSRETPVRIWDAETGKRLRDMGGNIPNRHFGSTRNFAFTPDGKQIYSARDQRTTIWDVATGKLLKDVEGPSFPIAISPDGKTIASGSGQRDWVIQIRDAKTFAHRLEFDGHRDSVEKVAYAPDGKTIATGDGNGVLRLWDVPSGKPVRKWKAHRYGVWHLEWARDGKTLFSTNNTKVFWDPLTGKAKHQVTDKARIYGPYVLHPKSPWFLGAGQWGKARFYDWEQGKLLDLLEDKGLKPGSVTLTSSGRLLVYNPDRDFLAVRDLTKEKVVWSVKQPTYGPLKLSPDDRRVYYCDHRTQELAVRRLSDHRRILRIPFAPRGCLTFALSGSGRALVAVAQDPKTWKQQVWLIETASGLVRRRFEGHINRITSIDFSPDNRTFATGSRDCTALIWDALSPPLEGKIDDDELWKILAGEDAEKAHSAMAILVAEPARALRLFGRLEATKPIPEGVLAELVETLVDDKAEAHAEAQKELIRLGSQAEGYLTKTVEKHPVAEVRLAVGGVLNSSSGRLTEGDLLRSLRAVEVLELIGGRDSRTILKKLADGDPLARLTQEARLALRLLR